MSGVKVWVISGIVYLTAVIAGYSFITGENPLTSGEMHEDHGADHEEVTENVHDDGVHDGHGEPSGEQTVEVGVTFEGGLIQVKVQDEYGHGPTLLETHERLMHLIVVRDDLEEFHHFHPEKIDDGLFETEASLNDGQYYVFVDMKPEGEKYVIEPIRIHAGEATERNVGLSADEELLQVENGKEVELSFSELVSGEHVTLSFDLKGETPMSYLGALGHVVIIDENIEQFIHVHPTSKESTDFDAYFPEQGAYKVWAEFKFEDEDVLVFPFVVEVE
ncbi:hypothetical protein LGQ02_01970 [Bacillus shivajii]|uniref:hypothetical protein n=1 Tax=Bacillus shivajii TaxID=1983719 RepID=UPI001CFB95B3|nr:hypothetical protein [Bacillus shivajii]UCZ53588.1 hypothetical protein LGQ02_01970 [Bacillus shivajii]